ncbi:alpha/beta hydrolase [Candidatus Alkanophaga liquidiphilum]|nr:Alpha/beta superfamily hydrolase [Candidatus Alkanophaga liquidiphilum]
MRGKEDVVVNGVRCTLVKRGKTCVVLCPPHPLFGGCRHDVRLVRIAECLADADISSLRLDYSKYSGGASEVEDVLSVLSFAVCEFKAVGVLGYSFGAVVSSNAVARALENGLDVKAFAALSILRRVNGLEATLSFRLPKLFIYGRFDFVAPLSEFEQLFEAASEPKERLVLDTDHFYGGVINDAAEQVCEFFSRYLRK